VEVLEILSVYHYLFVIVIIYSGLSHIASIIENKPLYSNLNNEYFDMLNVKNIIIYNLIV
jgi:hypothetical protein